MKKVLFIFICVLAMGCQTTNHSVRSNSREKPVLFISFPPGAVIEVDGTYKGRTPNVISLIRHDFKKEKDVPYYKVFIYPSQDGYCMQKTTLNPYDLPETLEFDLTHCSKEKEPFVLPNGLLGTFPETLTY